MPTTQGILSSKATQHKILIPVLICLALAIPTIQKVIKKDIGSVFMAELPLHR